jgi:hypothetical protein
MSTKYSVRFDAAIIPAGLYVYRFEAGSCLESNGNVMMK